MAKSEDTVTSGPRSPAITLPVKDGAKNQKLGRYKGQKADVEVAAPAGEPRAGVEIPGDNHQTPRLRTVAPP